jgi:ABC-type transporter Mla MlaB component
MSVLLNPDDTRMNIRIGGPLTVSEVADARDRLALGLATAPGPVEVNLSEITEVDTAGLQLLLALARVPGDVTLADPSAELVERVRHLKLDKEFHFRDSRNGS